MINEEKLRNCVKSGIFGLVVADALGVPYEFKSRDYCDAKPMTDMIGYCSYNQPPGTWSDDSSIALASLDGLSKFDLENSIKSNGEKPVIEDFSNIFDYDDIMKKIVSWYDEIEYNPHGVCFDIGTTTLNAIFNFKNGADALMAGGTNERSNGNGSLMRILPISFVIYFLSLKYDFSEEEEMQTIHNMSSLTHRHIRSQMGCGIYIKIAIELLRYRFEEKEGSILLEIVNKGINAANKYYSSNEKFKDEVAKYEKVFSLSIQDLDRTEVRGSGYVIRCLIAALWCLFNNENYKDTALEAVNLGEDTDTTAAVVGGLAGIYYGYEDIPEHWLDQIARFGFIEGLCEKFSQNLIDLLKD